VRRLSLIGLALIACHSGPAIRASADVVKSELDRARRNNAVRCAPRELATAEANLDFVSGELDQGNSRRAYEHLVDADAAAKKALALSRDCAPRQVVVKEEPRLVVKIEETDRDGDTVLDKDDQCPSLPGPVENRGCPLEAPKDTDGDGLADSIDKCVDQPEDKDGFQDEDGCPEARTTTATASSTLADKCPERGRPDSEPRLPGSGQGRRRHSRRPRQVPQRA
jgi:OOP family OmpA-OmpF porin